MLDLLPCGFLAFGLGLLGPPLDAGTRAAPPAPATAPGTTPLVMAAPSPPTSPPTSPPSAPSSAAPPGCDAEAWPAPVGTAPIPVRVVVDEGRRAFELLRPAPASAPSSAGAGAQLGEAPTPPALGAVACLWLNQAGGANLQMGIAGPEDRAGTAPPRPPPEARFARLTVAACKDAAARKVDADAKAGAVSTATCVRLERVPELDDAPGNVPALLRLPGTRETLSLALHETPSSLGLLGSLLAGLVGSFLVTMWAPKLPGLRDRRRRLRQLDARRQASEEDFAPLLNRVDALLELCRGHLHGWASYGRVFYFDDVVLDDRLREAEQLLDLSELKTRCWYASLGPDVPPSVGSQIADLLRRFDTEVFQLPLPAAVDPAAPERWHPPSLVEARRLAGKLDAVFHRTLSAAMQEVHEAAPPSPLPDAAEPTRRALFDLVERVRAAQVAALTPVAGKTAAELEALAPRLLRALDARVAVWRAAVELMRRLADTGRPPPPTHVREQMERDLEEWASQQMQAPVTGRLELPALRGLIWRWENHRAMERLERLLVGQSVADLTPPEPSASGPAAVRAHLRIAGPASARAFEPATFDLVLDQPAVARSYVWRQNVRVYWEADGAGAGAEALHFDAGSACGPDDPIWGVLDRKPGTGARLWRTQGGRTTLYASEHELRFTVRAVAFSLRDPITGEWQPPLRWGGPAGLEISTSVSRNLAATLGAGVGAGNLVRFFCSTALAVVTGLVFLDTLQNNAQGWVVYLQAFAWAFGIDFTTVALRSGWSKLQERLGALQLQKGIG